MFKLNIAQKIGVGFFAIILLVLLMIGFLGLFVKKNIIDENKKLDRIITQINNPSIALIDDLRFLVIRSKMLTYSWVHSPNENDKAQLRELQSEKFPELKLKIDSIIKFWSYQQEIDSMKMIFNDFQNLILYQREIMDILSGIDEYNDPMIFFVTDETYQTFVKPISLQIDQQIIFLISLKKDNASKAREVILGSFDKLITPLIIFIILLVFIVVIASYFTGNPISKRIIQLRNILNKVGKGELTEEIKDSSHDEIGQMTDTINLLTNSRKTTALFAEKIGKGDFSIGFQKRSEGDILGGALINMRDSLKEAAAKEQQNKWAIQGSVKFADILQRNVILEKLGYDIISNLVEYVDANQAGFFVIDEVDNKDTTLKLISAYAYNKEKSIKREFKIGEGIVGEAARDQKTVHLKNVPGEYISIVSGSVKAKPHNVLIIPLVYNKSTYGVMELTSLNSFSSIQVEFVKNLGEKIAVAINNIKANNRTKMLLDESKSMTEELKQQTEELITAQEQLQVTNKEISEANTRVNESIDYAQRIQQSILPTTENIRQIFPQSFIYYKPKDVVSGDFSWFYKKGDDVYIATVDCTGHGVPGALLSFIGYFLLNEIVGHTSTNPRPCIVLDLLQIAVKKILEQKNSQDVQTNDGMDVALCRINFQKSEVQYAGAYRHLYHICNGELTEYKGDRHSVGGIYHKNSFKYTNHSFKYKKGDMIFFFTDGLPDQFGGTNPEYDQYSTSRIQEIILNNQNLPMSLLFKKFEDDFEKWKGDTFQYDDVLMIGIRF